MIWWSSFCYASLLKVLKEGYLNYVFSFNLCCSVLSFIIFTLTQPLNFSVGYSLCRMHYDNRGLYVKWQFSLTYAMSLGMYWFSGSACSSNRCFFPLFRYRTFQLCIDSWYVVIVVVVMHRPLMWYNTRSSFLLILILLLGSVHNKRSNFNTFSK